MSLFVWPSLSERISRSLVYWACTTDKVLISSLKTMYIRFDVPIQWISVYRIVTRTRKTQLFLSTAGNWFLPSSRSIDDFYSTMSGLLPVSLLVIITDRWCCLHREEPLDKWPSEIQFRHDDSILAWTHLDRWSALARHWWSGQSSLCRTNTPST